MAEQLTQFMKDGKYLMLALDHRGSFLKLIGSEDEHAAQAAKREIIDSVKDQFSGVLIDREYGLPAYDKSKPFLLPLEKSGYTDQSGERVTQLEIDAARLKALGAAGAKLLVYFNPDLQSAEQQLKTAKQAIDDCKSQDMPIFLEIVTYDLAGTKEIVPDLVLRSLEAFIQHQIIPDVWKLEYPGNLENCRKVSAMVGGVPWILLTRGVTFDQFVPQIQAASEGRADGFLAGRALWQELFKLEGQPREEFLNKTLPDRFRRISQIALGN